jgi:hypothetical protein
VKTRGGREKVGRGLSKKGSFCEEVEVGVAVDSSEEEDGLLLVVLVLLLVPAVGSMVKVRTAVPVAREIVAVRVMGWIMRVSDSEVDAELVVELAVELAVEPVVELAVELAVELTPELAVELAVELPLDEDDCEEKVEEGADDSAVGSTVTVVVPKPLVVTKVTTVRVVGPVWLPVEDALEDEAAPVDEAVEVSDAVDDAPGSSPSGMVPRTCFARVIS